MSEKRKNYYAPMHTAEHILNKTMVNMFGCERSENCHIERKKSKCDFMLKEEPTDVQKIELEKKINEIIDSHIDVKESFVNIEEAIKRFKLHRINTEDNPEIRIISIGDYDDCPCIGEHVSNTKEIENFRITTTSFNDGIFRIRFKI